MSQTNSTPITTVPIPQPPPIPLLGNIKDVDPELPFTSFARLISQYGPIVKLALPGRTAVIVGSQELNIRAVAGDGLFTAYQHEPAWAIAHRVLMPAFGPLSIQSMFPGMVDIAGQLVAKWERFGDYKIDVVSDFTNLTLDTIALCTFSYRFNSFYSEDPPPFIKSMTRSLKIAGSKSRRLPMMGFLYHKEDQIFAEDVKLQHETAEEIIRKRIENPTDEKDLLNTMLKGRDPVTDDIRPALLFYYVLATPRSYQAIRTEVDTVCGREPVSLSHLPKLKYIDATIKETLRLQATAPGWTVQAKNDEIIGGKYAILKGQSLFVILGALHRDTKVWGDDVEDFRPERMLDGKFEALPPDSWKPFGNGMRGCIGRPFAVQESLYLIATFDIRPHDPGYHLQLKSTLTIKPANFFMRVAPRKDVAPLAFVSAPAPMRHDGTTLLERRANITSTGQEPLLRILYGSNSGTCEAFARQFMAKSARRRCKATISHLNEFPFGGLPTDGPLVIVTASYEGKPTDDACHFVEWLKNADVSACKDVSYAVFGCGHPDWASTFMAIPTLVNERLSTCGGTRLVDRGIGNAAGTNLPGEFEEWSRKLWAALSDTGRIGPATATGTTTAQLSARVDSSYRTSILRNEFLSSAKVLSTKVLTKDGAPIKRHIEIAIGENTTYRAGDYLTVLPLNSMDVNLRAIWRLGLHVDDIVELISSGDASESTLPIGKPMSALDMVAAFVELDQPASLQNVKFLAGLVKDNEAQKAVLDRLAVLEVYNEEVAKPRISLLRLMEDHPSIKVPLASFLQQLLPIRVRQYSISSSPLWNAHVVTLTVGALDAPHLSGKGQHIGLASHFLNQLAPGGLIRVAVRPSNVAFHPPTDPSVPILMFGAGTGMAPFRGFVQERAIQKAAGRDVGSALLFYGCRAKEEDLIYDEEMAAWAAEGVVSLRHAFSRRPEESSGCKYVQDRLYHDREEVKAMFTEAGARVFICGPPALAKGIETVCVKIMREVSGKSEEAAKAWFDRVQTERFATDVYA
ncbi:hypothetical protein FRB93_010327 [Tulasnella sp. JGI-2019a]|nr:hypothetical protein FRB93_010327 [Tulasnella sp. JGI-2019a]